MADEKIQVDYQHTTVYLITEINGVGATTSTTLRTIPTPGGDIAYVRKHGTDYLITDVTDIEDPVDANMKFLIYANNGTLLGSRVGGGAFVDGGTVTAQGCYMEIEASGGAITVLASITIDTDIDAGGLAFTCAAETVANGDTLRLYLSDTGSTYYDSTYQHGGDRHSPALNNTRKPYYTITTGLAACATANDDGVEVMDSATYDEDIAVSLSDFAIYCTAGQRAILTRGIGARASREVIHDGNNTDTKYINKAGSDSNPGTFQEPYLTVDYARSNMGGLTYLNFLDSNIYFEQDINFNAAITVEPAYGYTPIIRAFVGTVTEDCVIRFDHGSVNIYGLHIDGVNTRAACCRISLNTYSGTIQDNTIYDGTTYLITEASANFTMSGAIERNDMYGGDAAIEFVLDNNSTFSIKHNIIHDTTTSRNTVQITDSAGITVNADIQHNLLYDNGLDGFQLIINNGGSSFSGNIIHNTIYNSGYDGLRVTFTGFAGTIRDNISYNSGNTDLVRSGGAGVSITYSCYGTNSGFTLGAGMVQDNPDFCKITTPYQLGLRGDSPARKTGTGSDDMGVFYRILEINESDIEINGFIFDGQDQDNNAVFIADTVDHTGSILKWNSFYDFNGIIFDPFDNDADTDCTVSNCYFHDSGEGIKLSRGNNTVEECLFYNITNSGIYVCYAGQTFDHNTFAENKYGIYIDPTAGAINIKNSIFYFNSTNGIYSDVNVEVSYSCFNESEVTSTVTKIGLNNISDDPLFIDTISDPPDFRLKSKARTSLIDSPCLNGADDDYDMGCYLETRVISDDSRKKYVFEYNPREMDPVRQNILQKDAPDIEGSPYVSMRGRRRQFPFHWGNRQFASENDRDAVDMFHDFVSSPFNDLSREDVEMLLRLLPTTHMDSGTCTINTSALTVTCASKTWKKNKQAGWWITIKFFDMSNSTVSTVDNSITKTGAGFTDDEWNGYEVEYNGYRLVVLDTQGDAVFVSDPDGVLSDGTYSTYIEFSFYIESNDNAGGVLTILDPYSKILSANEGFYIDFIKVVVTSRRHKTKQFGRFIQTEETRKAGYSIAWGEI